jgi:hypothetical protein
LGLQAATDRCRLFKPASRELCFFINRTQRQSGFVYQQGTHHGQTHKPIVPSTNLMITMDSNGHLYLVDTTLVPRMETTLAAAKHPIAP